MRGMLRREGDSAEDLECTVRDVARRARSVRLRDRRGLERVRRVLVERRGSVEDARPRALHLDVHVGEQVSDRLEAPDRVPELAPLGRVLAGEVEHRGGGADGLGGREDSADRGEIARRASRRRARLSARRRRAGRAPDAGSGRACARPRTRARELRGGTSASASTTGTTRRSTLWANETRGLLAADAAVDEGRRGLRPRRCVPARSGTQRRVAPAGSDSRSA